MTTGANGLFGYGDMGGSMETSQNSSAFRNNLTGPYGGDSVSQPDFGGFDNMLGDANMMSQADMGGFGDMIHGAMSGLSHMARGGAVAIAQEILRQHHHREHARRGGVQGRVSFAPPPPPPPPQINGPYAPGQAPVNASGMRTVNQLAGMDPKAPPSNFDFQNSMRAYYDLINSGKLGKTPDGYSNPNAAAAYAGNLSYEAKSKDGSQMQFDRVEQGQPFDKAGIGMAQWTNNGRGDFGRRTDFENFSQAIGKPWQSPEANMGNMARELGSSYSKVNDAVNAQPDLARATAAAGRFYEHPNAADLNKSFPSRLGMAEGIQDRADAGNPFKGSALNDTVARLNAPEPTQVAAASSDGPDASTQERKSEEIAEADAPEAEGGEDYARGGVISDALYRLRKHYAEGGGEGAPDERSQEEFLKRELRDSAPQYVEENDFPARAARGVETADRYAGALNNALAGAAGLPDGFKHPEGRSAGEIIQSALPQDPNQVSKDAMDQYRAGDYAGAAQSMMSMPQAGMFLTERSQGVDRQALQTAKNLIAGSDRPRPYSDLFDRVGVEPRPQPEVTQQYGWHPYGDHWFTEIADDKAGWNGKREFDNAVERYRQKAHDAFMQNYGHAPQDLVENAARDATFKQGYSTSASKLWDHPELWKAEPGLANMPVLIAGSGGGYNLGNGTQGYFNPSSKIMGLRGTVARDAKEGPSVFAHEVQHAIQDAGGVPAGSSPEKEAKRGDINPLWHRFHHQLANDPHFVEFQTGIKSPEFRSIMDEYGKRANDLLYRNESGNMTWDSAKAAASDEIINKYPFFRRMRELEDHYKSRNVPLVEPLKQSPTESYRHNSGEAQARNTQYRLNWDMKRRRENDPLLTIPYDLNSTDARGSLDPSYIQYRKAGGRVGLEEGGVPPEDDREKFSKWAHEEAARETPTKGLMDIAGYGGSYGVEKARELPEKAQQQVTGAVTEPVNAAYHGTAMALGQEPWDQRKAEQYANTIAGSTTLGAGAMEAPAGALTAGAARRAESGLYTPAAPRIIRPSEVDTPTVRSILSNNGYDLPEGLSFSGELDKPARPQTLTGLSQSVEQALKDHLALPEGKQEANAMRAREAMAPYVGRDVSGEPNNLISQNSKQGKAAKVEGKVLNQHGVPVDTWGLSLSPYLQWQGLNLCPKGQVCSERCLGKRGGYYAFGEGFHDNYAMNAPRERAMARSLALMQDPENFAVSLYEQLRGQSAMSRSKGYSMAARLNTLSDLHPGVFRAIRQAMPGTSFYDYTKVPIFAKEPNFHQTFSSTGISAPGIYNPHSNWDASLKALDSGRNVAMVVSEKNKKPSKVAYKGREYETIDGDVHDYRPADAPGKDGKGRFVILGRKDNSTNAANAMKESNGFYVHYDPKKHGDTLEIPDQDPYRAKRARGGRLAAKWGLPEGMYFDQFHNGENFEDVDKAIPILRGKDRRDKRR